MRLPATRLPVGLAAAALLATLGLGCEKPKPGTPVTFENVCSAEFDPTMEKGLNVTKRVAIEGYVGPLRSSVKVCSDTCDFNLFAEPDGKGKRVNADVPVGDGKNQMERLPKSFSDKDLKLHTSDGKVVGVGAKVRITGGRSPAGGKRETCSLWQVSLIEAL
ncbi:hypothetical protein [Polyangium mundeleinium]|uniref:Lipoprotein n=1 Tax=Polyangium mundeleinium TaxID=2995306 RepID=A0ABT5EV99_9BACT|nr:hypothetical protein [Polyangium mundeleinium]MDC0744715.1 hypothetical protein [Polyangium mundeleinium]